MRLRAISFSLLLSVSGLAEEATRHVFVNGGSIPTANYSVHESDLKAFRDALFGSDSHYLNASGPTNYLVTVADSGELERGADGWVKMTESSLIPKAKPAIKSELLAQAASLKTDKVRNAVFVYGDHGSEEGLSLWNEDTFSPAEMREMHTELPAYTLLRSIHLHCFPGKLLADPARKVPKDSADWEAYLKKYYRPKSCGLAVGQHDELGQYLSWGTPNPWPKMISAADKPSLASLKEELMNRKDLNVAPSLTSDFLVEDLASYFCGLEGPDASETPRKSAWTHGGPDTLRGEGKESRCDFKAQEATLSEATSRFKKAETIWGELRTAKNELAAGIVEAHEPELAKKYWAARERLEAFQKTFPESPQKKRDPNLHQKVLEAVVDELRTKDVLAFEYRLLHVADGLMSPKEMETAFRENSFRDRLASPEGAVLYSHLKEFLKSDGRGSRTLEALGEETDKDLQSTQIARRDLIHTQQRLRRSYVESRLAQYPALKEHYNAIQACESSSLR